MNLVGGQIWNVGKELMDFQWALITLSLLLYLSLNFVSITDMRGIKCPRTRKRMSLMNKLCGRTAFDC